MSKALDTLQGLEENWDKLADFKKQIILQQAIKELIKQQSASTSCY